MKKAFTLMELIFVIIVVAILSAVMIPNVENNSLKQSAQQVASDIRYTQHLAMINDRYNPLDLNGTGTVKWYKTRWQILFSNNNSANGQWAYTIFSDSYGNSTGNPNRSEIATNPGDISKIMTGGQSASDDLNISDPSFIGMNRLNLGLTYNITSVTFSNSCSYYNSKRLIFDYMGRPLIGNIRSLTLPYDNAHILKQDCNITLTHADGNSIVLTVQAETGFVKINY